MPNGTYGGVRGERKSPLLDKFLLTSIVFYDIVYLIKVRQV